MWRRTGGSLSGWIVFVGSLLFYVATLAPGIQLWDTGEMQTVPYALFIAHPTGFPLFVLAGWLFSHVVAFGEPAWRLSLFSAVAAAFAAAMLTLFVYDLTRSSLVAGVAGSAFAAVGIVWSTAVRADVHDLALACTTLALVFAHRAGMHPERANLPSYAALAWGAGVATHPVVVFALPALFALAWPALLTLGYVAIARLTLVALAPLLFYAYVPLRSLAIDRAHLDPNVVLGLRGSALVNDGDPASAAAFAHYVLATRFAPADSFARFFSSGGIAHALAFARALAYSQYGYAALAFALLGLGALAWRSPRVAFALATLAIGGIAFAANYVVESAPERYALAGLWAISACVAYGTWWFATTMLPLSRVAIVVAAIAVAACAVPGYADAAAHVAKRNVRGDARDVANAIVRTTSPGSVIVASWEYATPLAYAKYVAGTLGTRLVASGWPTDYRGHYVDWHRRFGHVYFVVPAFVPVARAALRLTSPDARWKLWEYES